MQRKAYVEENGRLVRERHGDDTSLGMTKFYRVSCFEAIGGFVREVMWAGIERRHQMRALMLGKKRALAEIHGRRAA